MTSRSEKFELFQKSVLDHLTKVNNKLDRLCALSVSNQLLQECVGPDGSGRTAEECADIVVESFMAGICLTDELDNRTREFDYQKSEFFIDQEVEDEDEENEEEDDDENTNNSNAPRRPVNAF
jgi:hypothetical protein